MEDVRGAPQTVRFTLTITARLLLSIMQQPQLAPEREIWAEPGLMTSCWGTAGMSGPS